MQKETCPLGPTGAELTAKGWDLLALLTLPPKVPFLKRGRDFFLFYVYNEIDVMLI